MVRINKPRDLIIRRAVSADAPILVALARELNALQGDPVDRFSIEAAERDIFARDTGVIALIAELDRAAAGYAMLAPSYDTGRAAHGYYVGDLYVTEAARARGAGRALMTACAAAAKRAGKSYLWFCSKAWNVDAHAFYRKLGAAEEPVMAHALTSERFAALAREGDALFETEFVA